MGMSLETTHDPCVARRSEVAISRQQDILWQDKREGIGKVMNA
jgi:hypothetical protein